MRALGKVTRLVLPALLVATALAPRAAAQCMPDNLDTQPCCSPVSATLPVFPAISQQCVYASFNNCATALNRQLCVTIGAPVPAMLGGQIVCGVYLINFQVRTCGTSQLIWSGNIRAHYARNWQEFDPVTTRGVWRFLLNGDLASSMPASTPQTARPRCLNNYPRVYFSGYIDYAYDCNLNTWLAAFALNHECDFTTHVAGTARPIAGGSHPTRSYVLVGPSAGFVVDPANGPWISGGAGDDSMRKNNWPNVPNICLAEERLLAPSIVNPVNLLCECTPSSPGAPTQFGETQVQARGGCGSLFDTSNPPIGPFPFTQKAIGYWTNFLTFPSPSHLFIDHGTMLHNDGCTNTPSTQYVEGVTTLTSGVAIGSYTAGQFLGPNIVDLATSNGVGGAVQVGKPHVTWYLIGINY
ncbi:MAG: hypothetical protein HYR85_15605 [Planctomycetes bacterium]|nr:hypothetical protein [Planctomycetota bacterium]